MFNKFNRIGNPAKPANKPTGTVIKFNPGIKAVNKPLSINGINNGNANSGNEIPLNSACNNPATNAAINAGNKLSNPFVKKMIGKAINLRASFVKNVPTKASNGMLIHVRGLKNANGPKTGANSSIPANHTKNGTMILIAVSIKNINGKPMNKFKTDRTNVINGAKKIAVKIKLNNGIKLGIVNNAKAITGSLKANSRRPRIAINPNAPSARTNGNTMAFNKPRPLINNGSIKKPLNKFNSVNGNVTKP